jgi:hypothetical protein
MNVTPAEYASWIASTEPSSAQLKMQRQVEGNIALRPLISILLPLHNPPPAFLRSAIESVLSQTYTNWEACIALAREENEENSRYLEEISSKDPRFRLLLLDTNGGISANSNAALSIAKGEFIALLDHDDELSPFALFEMVTAINAEPTSDLLYSDKDCIKAEGNVRLLPLLKPCWSPENLLSANYLTHLNVIRRSLVADIGGFRTETEGAQDWDLFLRIGERTRAIVRVPGIHYHWRIHEGSTSSGIEAKPYAGASQLRAVRDHVLRRNLPATVLPHCQSAFHVHWNPEEQHGIHIVIDAVTPSTVPDETTPQLHTLLQNIGEAVFNIQSTGGSVSILATDLASIPALNDAQGFLCAESEKAAMINAILSKRMQSQDAVVFVSRDAVLPQSNWLQELVSWVTCHPDIGFAGGLVLDSTGDLIEAGLALDEENQGHPFFRGVPPYRWGCFGSPLWYRNCSAVSPWLAAVAAHGYRKAGGLDTSLPWPRSFHKLCRSITENGLRGIVNPHVRISIASGQTLNTPEFNSSLKNDPYFHPFFSSITPIRFDTLGADLQRGPRVAATHPPRNPAMMPKK